MSDYCFALCLRSDSTFHCRSIHGWQGQPIGNSSLVLCLNRCNNKKRTCQAKLESHRSPSGRSSCRTNGEACHVNTQPDNNKCVCVCVCVCVSSGKCSVSQVKEEECEIIFFTCEIGTRCFLHVMRFLRHVARWLRYESKRIKYEFHMRENDSKVRLLFVCNKTIEQICLPGNNENTFLVNWHICCLWVAWRCSGCLTSRTGTAKLGFEPCHGMVRIPTWPCPFCVEFALSPRCLCGFPVADSHSVIQARLERVKVSLWNLLHESYRETNVGRWMFNLCGSSNCPVCFLSSRPGGGRTEGAGPQLSPVLPLPLGTGAAQPAAVLPAHRPHGAGAGRHRGVGREHEDPVLPGNLWAPGPAAEREHLRRVRWVPRVEIWFYPFSIIYLRGSGIMSLWFLRPFVKVAF